MYWKLLFEGYHFDSQDVMFCSARKQYNSTFGIASISRILLGKIYVDLVVARCLMVSWCRLKIILLSFRTIYFYYIKRDNDSAIYKTRLPVKSYLTASALFTYI